MYSIKNNIIYLNLQNGGGNMYDPSGNLNDPSGNMYDPSGNVNDPSGNVNDPSGNVNDPSGNVNDPSGNVNDPSGNMYDVSIYKNKYIKYKLKYIKLKQQLGGNTLDDDIATYELLEKTEELEKLRIIKYSSDVGIIASLLDYYDSTIVDHARVKLIELQEGVAPQVVAPQVVAPQVVAPQVVAQPAYNPSRNPGINRAPPIMPETQSPFYMPLISEAYYLARGLQVPQPILDAGCGVINLGVIISPATYNRMVTTLADHLRQNGNIDLLTQDYVLDNRHFPTDHSVGHIDGEAQVRLLERPIFEGLPLVVKLERAIQVHYGR